MGRYFVPGSITALSTAFKTGAQISATSGAARRGFIMGIEVSQLGAPNATDCQIQYDLPRITAPSTTATAFTPAQADQADAACAATAGISPSTEGAVTANSQLFSRGINQRSSYGWFANDRLAALIFPATPSNGFALRGQNTVAAAFAGTGLTGLTFEE